MIGHDGGREEQEAVSKACLVVLFCLMAAGICIGQENASVAQSSNPADYEKPVPVLSGGIAFVPIWDGGSPTLVSIVSPVLLVPLGSNLIFESRAAFEGDFERRDGKSGDFTGGIDKSIDYMELDYLANRYVTVTAGRFLTPFNIYNERLYPNWIRDTQTDPLIFPIGTGSDNGLMLRGGITACRTITLNYALYVSALTTADHFESERHTGMRASIFLPRERLELGMSAQHQLQDNHITRYGVHLQWQPRRAPFDLRAEGVYSLEEGSGLWLEGAYRLRNASQSRLRGVQFVGRTQLFNTGSVPGINADLPDTSTKRTEIGVNYYLNDGWKALASYGRTFTAAGNSNIWTVGMTYRFVVPLGAGQ